MRYLILGLILAGLPSFVGATPAFADAGAGVSVTLTTIVTGGSSNGGSIGGGGEYIDYGGGVIPNMSTDDTITNMKKYWLPPIPDEKPVVAPEQEWKPIIDQPLLPKETENLPPVTVVEETPKLSMASIAGIAFWVIIIGIAAWLLWMLLGRRKVNKE